MDILAHGLWAGAIAKTANLKKERKLNVWLAAFWGVFPDLFAFTIPFVWLFGNMLLGNINFSDIHRPTDPEPETKYLFGNGDTRQTQSSIAYLTSSLYNVSHSLLVFLLVFALVILVRKLLNWFDSAHHKKENIVPWEMFGWMLHILLDLPTHSYAFYPTPVFWPLAGWKFNGYSWAHPLFMAINYSAIIITYLTIRYFEKKKS